MRFSWKAVFVTSLVMVVLWVFAGFGYYLFKRDAETAGMVKELKSKILALEKDLQAKNAVGEIETSPAEVSLSKISGKAVEMDIAIRPDEIILPPPTKYVIKRSPPVFTFYREGEAPVVIRPQASE